MNKPKYQIGNYISTEYGELEIKNTAFGDYQVIGLDGRILWANEINPIILTDNWMIKLNAILQPWGWVVCGIIISSNHKGHYWTELGNGKRIDFKLVHKLQNFLSLISDDE